MEKLQVIAFRKGGVKCSSACPFYTETGTVKGVRGVPLKTHCRMTMNPWMVDCDLFDTHHIFKVEVTEEQFKQMCKSVKKRPIRQRKLYPDEHEEIHAVGCEWTRRRASAGEKPFGSKGKWNAEKSSIIKSLQH